jgi:heme exporter protein D
MRLLYGLALIPVCFLLIGPVLHNQVHPLILGMPFPLGWISIWITIIALVMLVIYRLDPRNGDSEP